MYSNRNICVVKKYNTSHVKLLPNYFPECPFVSIFICIRFGDRDKWILLCEILYAPFHVLVHLWIFELQLLQMYHLYNIPSFRTTVALISWNSSPKHRFILLLLLFLFCTSCGTNTNTAYKMYKYTTFLSVSG